MSNDQFTDEDIVNLIRRAYEARDGVRRSNQYLQQNFEALLDRIAAESHYSAGAASTGDSHERGGGSTRESAWSARLRSIGAPGSAWSGVLPDWVNRLSVVASADEIWIELPSDAPAAVRLLCYVITQPDELPPATEDLHYDFAPPRGGRVPLNNLFAGGLPVEQIQFVRLVVADEDEVEQGASVLQVVRP